MRQLEEPTRKEVIGGLRSSLGTSWFSWIGLAVLLLLCAILFLIGAFTFVVFLDIFGKGEPRLLVVPFVIPSLASMAAAVHWGVKVWSVADKRKQ